MTYSQNSLHQRSFSSISRFNQKSIQNQSNKKDKSSFLSTDFSDLDENDLTNKNELLEDNISSDYSESNKDSGSFKIFIPPDKNQKDLLFSNDIQNTPANLDMYNYNSKNTNQSSTNDIENYIWKDLVSEKMPPNRSDNSIDSSITSDYFQSNTNEKCTYKELDIKDVTNSIMKVSSLKNDSANLLSRISSIRKQQTKLFRKQLELEMSLSQPKQADLEYSELEVFSEKFQNNFSEKGKDLDEILKMLENITSEIKTVNKLSSAYT